jgi:hypothetical protein
MGKTQVLVTSVQRLFFEMLKTISSVMNSDLCDGCKLAMQAKVQVKIGGSSCRLQGDVVLEYLYENPFS